MKNLIYYKFLLLIVVLIWGSGFVAVDYVLKSNWNVNLIMFSRFLIASIFMFILFFKDIVNIKKIEILNGAIAGIFLYLAFMFQTLGQTKTNVSNVAFFTATNVVMIPFISFVINKQRLKIKTILLSFLSLLGVFILTYSNGKIVFNKGDLLTLISAFFFASQIAYLEKANKNTNYININFVQILTAAIISSMFLYNVNISNDIDIFNGFIGVFYLAIFSTGICYYLQTKAQKYVKASTTGIILSLEGFFGSLFSILLKIEPFRLNIFVGGFLIILSTIFIGDENEKI